MGGEPWLAGPWGEGGTMTIHATGRRGVRWADAWRAQRTGVARRATSHTEGTAPPGLRRRDARPAVRCGGARETRHLAKRSSFSCLRRSSACCRCSTSRRAPSRADHTDHTDHTRVRRRAMRGAERCNAGARAGSRQRVVLGWGYYVAGASCSNPHRAPACTQAHAQGLCSNATSSCGGCAMLPRTLRLSSQPPLFPSHYSSCANGRACCTALSCS